MSDARVRQSVVNDWSHMPQGSDDVALLDIVADSPLISLLIELGMRLLHHTAVTNTKRIIEWFGAKKSLKSRLDIRPKLL
jgi:hypothetical protein